jgi:hypothetical protein
MKAIFDPNSVAMMSAYQLIEKLDRDFPHRCPKPDQREREIWMNAGKRELVDHLLYLKKKEENV